MALPAPSGAGPSLCLVEALLQGLAWTPDYRYLVSGCDGAIIMELLMLMVDIIWKMVMCDVRWGKLQKRFNGKN